MIVRSYIPVITLNVNGPNYLIKIHRVMRRIKMKDPITYWLQETNLSLRTHIYQKRKDEIRKFHVKGIPEREK